MTRLHRTHVILSLLLTVLLIQPAWAQNFSKTKLEKEKQKKLEEAVKKDMTEEELERLRKKNEQIERITKQQLFIQEHNRRVKDAIARTRFSTAIALIDKDVFEVDEKIAVDYILKNKSSKTFFVDGRKFHPTFVVKDDSGNVVLTLKKSKRQSPPKEKDLIALGPGKTFSPEKFKPFQLKEPGKYTLMGSYVFLKPKGEEAEERGLADVWVGTVLTYTREFEVVKKK